MRPIFAILALLVATVAQAQRSVPQLVRDVTASRADDSRPRHFVSDGRVAYFFARDDNGIELWKSDGTSAGTRMVADIGPATRSALSSVDPRPMISGDYVYFWSDAENGVDLWRSDGTASGTLNLTKRLPQSFRLPPLDGSKGRAVPFGAHGAIFTVPAGNILYITDGTREGTSQINVPLPFLDENTLIASAGAVYYMRGLELWCTNGTSAGTRSVARILFDNALVRQIIDANGLVFVFTRRSKNYELWRSDGTSAGTQRVALFEEDNDHYLGEPRVARMGTTAFVVLAYYDTRSSLFSVDLWRSDGSPAGTTKVTTIRGSFGSFELLAATDRLLFFSLERNGQHAIWYSDGTAAGTNTAGSTDAWLFTAGTTRNKVFFLGASNTRAAIFCTEGAPNSVRELRPYTILGSSASFAAIGDSILTSASDAQHGDELWISDGTAAGTRLLQNIAADDGSDGTAPFRFGGSILFSAQTAGEGREPWISDGTPDGTHLLADIDSGPRSSYARAFADLQNGQALFIAEELTHGRELWSTDGTAAGTRLLGDLTSGRNGSFGYDDPIVILGPERAIFFANGALWTTNGTENGTSRLGSIESFFGMKPLVLNSVAYISAPTGLWKSDGRLLGTVLVDRNGIALGIAGSKLFFTTGDSSRGKELWVTDGTVAGTRYVFNMSSWGGTLRRSWAVDVGGVLFFAGEDDVHGIEPWRSDGTSAGTYMIKDIVAGSGSSHVVIDEGGIAAAYGGRAYFVADDGIHGAEVWQSDGTDAGTKMVKDIAEGPASSYPSQMKTAGGRLFFAANDFEHGRELWMLEGESATLVDDLNPGPASSAPRDFTLLRQSLLFFATHADTGRELWSLPLTEDPDTTLPDRSR
jgi:ELWxxDGT repeat protein